MTSDRTCVVCGIPATWRIYPDDDPDLMDEGWFDCDDHVGDEPGRHGVEPYPWVPKP